MEILEAQKIVLSSINDLNDKATVPFCRDVIMLYHKCNMEPVKNTTLLQACNTVLHNGIGMSAQQWQDSWNGIAPMEFSSDIKDTFASLKNRYAKHFPCKAVIFDMDGVIFDSEKLVQLCWQEIANRYNLGDMRPICKACLGMNQTKAKEVMEKLMGNGFDYTTRKQEMSAVWAERYHNGKIPMKFGIVELLQWLKAQGISTAVASSTREAYVRRELEEAGILQYFDSITTGDMVTHSKPHPEIYLHAASKLGISPSDCIAIEDAFAGVRSATSAGIRTIMVPDQMLPDDEMRKLAVEVVPNLLCVKEIVFKA